MSYDNEKRKGFRIYQEVFTLELDVNDGDYSADVGSYNTPKTTLDQNAFLAGNVKPYSYAKQNIGFFTVFPKLNSVSITPAVLKIGEDVALSASGQASLFDFISNDTFELPQAFNDRRVSASHFGKLFARNYILNRDCRILQGYGESFDLNNFRISNFIVKGYSPPNKTGAVTINLIDRLFFASESKNKCPATSDCILNMPPDGLLIGITTVEFTGTTFGDKNRAGVIAINDTGTVNIDNELMSYTVTAFSIDPVTFIGSGTMTVVRAISGGGLEEDHSDGQSIQGCVSWSEINVTDIIRQIFNDFTNIGQGFIDDVAWDLLKTGTMSEFNLTNILTKPVEVRKLLKELMQSTGAWLYYDVISDLITLGYTPRFSEAIILIDDSEHILQDSMSIKILATKQATRAKIAYNKRDYTESNELRQYRNTFEARDDLLENPAHYDQVNDAKTIISNWYTGSIQDQQTANNIATIKALRFAEPPVMFNFKLDARYIGDIDGATNPIIAIDNGDLWYGSVIKIKTSRLINNDGTQRISTAQIISIKPNSQDDSFDVQAISYQADQLPDNDDVDLRITSDQVSFNLANAIQPVDVKEYIVVINSGVIISGYSVGGDQRPALIQGAFPIGSTLKIINQGIIIGYGGDGGRCAYDSPSSGVEPSEVGTQGGLAIEITTDLTLDNSTGVIGGGGGGGGGGGLELGSGAFNTTASGGGGGGGAGRALSDGGFAHQDRSMGKDGTQTDGGAGGENQDGINYLGSGFIAISGGFGGGLGVDGQSPLQPIDVGLGVSPSSAGGIAGDAIQLNGNTIIYEGLLGIILGDVI